MELSIELNEKHGKGYQIHLTHGPVDKVLDDKPFTMYEAMQGAMTAVEIMNKELGTSYEFQKILRITSQGVTVNKELDLISARFNRDIRNGGGDYLIPKRADFIRDTVDGKEEILMTGRGIIIFVWLTWKDEQNQIAKDALRRYCNLLAIRGYGKGASQILEEILAQDREQGAEWVKATYAKYIRDDMEAMRILQG